MKSKRVLVLVFLVLLIVTMLGPQSVTATAILTEFTGTEGKGEITYPGITVPIPNGGSRLRGLIFVAPEDSTDPRMSGTATVVMNANFDPSLTGPWWGTIVWKVEDSEGCPGEGTWQGTYAGKVSYTQFYAYYHAELQGVSGCVEGMKASIDADCFAGTYSGTILDPHGE